MRPEHYAIFETSLGLCGIVHGSRGLIKIYLPGIKKGKLKKTILSVHENALEGIGNIKIIARNIRNYFNGDKARLDFSVDMEAMTDFDKKVYKQAMKISFGKIETYKWLAEKIGVPAGARAVGNALGRNPVPLIIPCHRIVRSDGKLGGFSAPGGLLMKKKMLSIEGHLNYSLTIQE